MLSCNDRDDIIFSFVGFATSIFRFPIKSMSSGQDWCKALCHALLSGTGAVDDLSIDGTIHGLLEEAELISIFDALRKNKRLIEFSIRSLDLTRASISALVPALKNCHYLEQICIEDVRDVDECLPELLAVTLFFNRSVKRLALRSCWINSPVSGYSIGSMLNAMLHLEELQISHNHIDENAAAAMGIALKLNSSLKVLDLTGSSMGCAAIYALARGLGYNKTLTILILNFNCFGDHGCEGLAKMLERNDTLQELHFFGNRVTAKGTTTLAEALKTNTTLRALEMSFNRIGDEGVTKLAECLTVNTTLEKVWFPYNCVGCDGLLAFAGQLPKMKGLKELYVGLLLHDDIEIALAKALQYNLHLSILYMEKPTVIEEEDGALSPIAKGMDFYLRCNKSGRRLLLERNVEMNLWSHFLSSAISNGRCDGTPDVLHYMVRSNPTLFQCRKNG